MPIASGSGARVHARPSGEVHTAVARPRPRPERQYFVDQLTRDIPFYAVRHSVKPGVTGWAQVRYHYAGSLSDTTEKLQYDLYYVKNHSLFLDLLIILETVQVVLLGKGAR